MRTISFVAHGLPVAQPRAKACVFAGRARVYDPGTANAWKACVIGSAKEAMRSQKWETTAAAVSLTVTFFMPRPKSHFGSGKNAEIIKRSAPNTPTTKPDLDNLEKAVMDALTNAGVWRDDSQVVCKYSRKVYSPSPFAEIHIEEEA